MDPIITYLTIRDLLCEKTEAREVRYRLAWYHLIDVMLYNRGFTIPYLRCIHPNQVTGILQEIHCHALESSKNREK